MEFRKSFRPSNCSLLNFGRMRPRMLDLNFQNPGSGSVAAQRCRKNRYISTRSGRCSRRRFHWCQHRSFLSRIHARTVDNLPSKDFDWSGFCHRQNTEAGWYFLSVREVRSGKIQSNKFPAMEGSIPISMIELSLSQ